MENEDVIREQMEDTRTAMTEKLEKLEQKVVNTVTDTTNAVTESVEAVKDTVMNTTEAVSDTVEKVKETVQETVQTVTDTVAGGVKSVRDFFTPRKHPWICMGSSVLAGFVLGKLLLPRRESPETKAMAAAAEPFRGALPRGNGHQGMASASAGRSHGGSRNGGHRDQPGQTSQSKGWLQGIAEQLSPELEKVKAMALGMLLDASRDFLQRMVPPAWQGHLMGIFQNLAHKLHAEPSQPGEQPQQQGYTHEEQGEDRGRQEMERSGNRGGKKHRFDR